MFNPDSFTSSIQKGGLSRGNRYKLSISLPIDFASATGIVRDITFRINSVDLPGKQIATNEVKIQGPVRKMPYATIFEDLNFSVMLSENLVERKLFSTWMDFAYDPSTSYVGYYNNIVAPATFEAYGQNSETSLYKLKFQDAYPISIGGINFAYGNEDIAVLPVTMSYRKYELEHSSGNGAPAIDAVVNDVGASNALARQLSEYSAYNDAASLLSLISSPEPKNLLNYAAPYAIQEFEQLQNNGNAARNLSGQIGAIPNKITSLTSTFGIR